MRNQVRSKQTNFTKVYHTLRKRWKNIPFKINVANPRRNMSLNTLSNRNIITTFHCKTTLGKLVASYTLKS